MIFLISLYRYFREIAETDKHNFPNGKKRDSNEVLFKGYHVSHLPWKKYEAWDCLIDSGREAPLQNVQIKVERLCHVTHEQPAGKISRRNSFKFIPTPKVGKAGYGIYDGSPVGESFITCEPNDQPPNDDTKYQRVSSTEDVFPGNYIWWSIDHCISGSVPWLYKPSETFSSSSWYGNVKFSGEIKEILGCYQKAYGTNPLPRIQFRCGGTLRYKYEICKVVIICTDAYPLPEDEFPKMWEDHIKYTEDGRIKSVNLEVVIRNGIYEVVLPSKKYSWDTYAFGLHFPNKTYSLKCPKSEKFKRSKIDHTFCITTKPDPNNGNKFTCPNKLLPLVLQHENESSDDEEQAKDCDNVSPQDESESDDEKKYISRKKQRVDDDDDDN